VPETWDKTRLESADYDHGLCAQEFLSYALQEPFCPCTKRLVGRKICPHRAAVAQVDSAGFSLGQPTRDFLGYRGFQFREPLVDLSQKREMRVAPIGADEKARNPGEGLPRNTRAEVLQSSQIVSPQVVYDAQGDLPLRLGPARNSAIEYRLAIGMNLVTLAFHGQIVAV